LNASLLNKRNNNLLAFKRKKNSESTQT